MKKLLKTLAKGIGALLPVMLLILGALAVSYGAAMIYRPAGMIALGAFLLGFGALMILGGDSDEQ